MNSISALIEMQEGKRKRPFLCRIGFHRDARVDWLITTGHNVCVKCGSVTLDSLFGDFGLSRRESASFLRQRADKSA